MHNKVAFSFYKGLPTFNTVLGNFKCNFTKNVLFQNGENLRQQKLTRNSANQRLPPLGLI
jgi:hypothetical protein